LVEELKIGDWAEIVGPSEGGKRSEVGEVFKITQTGTDGLAWLGGDFAQCFSAEKRYPYPAKSLRKLARKKSGNISSLS
jgi:hypothetical protein